MLSKEKIKKVLSVALSTGGDFAEVFVEEKLNNKIVLTSGSVKDIISGKDYGIGIRIFKGLKCIYAYTNDDSITSLINTANRAALALGDVRDGHTVNLNLVERINTNIHPVLYVPSSISATKKIEKMKEAYNGAKGYSEEIAQATVSMVDEDQKVLIANSEGLFTEDRRIRSRISVNAIASNGVDNQSGMRAPGASMGFEFFDTIDLGNVGNEAARTAVTMLHADYCPAGKMTVAIESGFGGVIFHEACGHSLEATSVAKGNSVFCNKLGSQIASSKVTAIDDGTIANAWGSLNIDDEGNPTQRKILIENGILKSYMIDKFNSRRMGMPSTGSGRRESYKYAPTSRMTNTFIANGEDDNEEIIKSIENGLYAKQMGGGSVNPITGDFNFNVLEGYLVKNGVIDRAVRGASLIGNGAKILMDIDMVGKNLDHGQGVCGSLSGSVPTNVGQPLLRVKEITVGGR
ncbi:TldD/PmbA family protein [Clostridium sp. LIBA-8841]|uniref:TldD/PmbA family protein n=1 Tax=Clostridium sp. LIBA-8841 TaxID=2987530 RepID=UPI002AC71D81|nr:TldD/PmbA family protein [Clostridium sp. LIBA-8841]MDZ5254579.1 TldD/PmbA family protein [Clostridium sp. LIBA-8841]